jgi:hypothetical protein
MLAYAKEARRVPDATHEAGVPSVFVAPTDTKVPTNTIVQ